MPALALLILVALLCTGSACASASRGGSTADAAGSPDTPDALPVVLDSAAEVADSGGDSLGCGTLYVNDCADGGWCFGPSECGSEWACQPEFPGCSAAPPHRVCGCDGTVTSVAAGCPDRFAWSLESFSFAWLDEGTPCDSSAKPPLTVALRIEGTAFDGAAKVTVSLPGFPDIAPLTVVATEGTFVARFGGIEHQATKGFAVRIWADTDGDDECTDGVDYAGAANPTSLDALALVIHYAITPDSLVAQGCAQVVP